MADNEAGGAIAWIRMRIAVFRQKPNQVFRRHPGDRSLVGPYPVAEEARKDWEFAVLSVAAYGRSDPKRQPVKAGMGLLGTLAQMWTHRTLVTPAVPDMDEELREAGWRRWPDFPDAKLELQMRISHLRAEVWEKADRSCLAVAFGGTVFTSGKDWKSNLRWLIPKHKDEYTAIVSQFGPDLVTTLERRISDPETAYLKNVKIYATGHSLGGGLAQQFAYAMPHASGVSRVSEVYAFDPSPVTGFYSVKKAIREVNSKGLQIGRIYERGEALAILRSFTSLVFKPSAANPTIRGTRFNLFFSWNAIAGHSIAELAQKMRAAAGAGSDNPALRGGDT